MAFLFPFLAFLSAFKEFFFEVMASFFAFLEFVFNHFQLFFKVMRSFFMFFAFLFKFMASFLKFVASFLTLMEFLLPVMYHFFHPFVLVFPFTTVFVFFHQMMVFLFPFFAWHRLLLHPSQHLFRGLRIFFCISLIPFRGL